MIDQQRNVRYWSNMRASYLIQYSYYENASPNSEANVFSSLEERGLACLEDFFHFKLLGETIKANVVGLYAEQVLRDALQKRKFEGYRRAWGIEGEMTRHELDAYEIRGEVRCLWYLRLLEIIKGVFDSNGRVSNVNSMITIWDQYSPKTQTSNVEFLNDYSMIWLSYDEHESYVNFFEAVLGSEDAKLKAKNGRLKAAVVYNACQSILSGDGAKLRKTLDSKYKKSLTWYEISAEYPWWERLIWMYVYDRYGMENVNVGQFLNHLRGCEL